MLVKKLLIALACAATSISSGSLAAPAHAEKPAPYMFFDAGDTAYLTLGFKNCMAPNPDDESQLDTCLGPEMDAQDKLIGRTYQHLLATAPNDHIAIRDSERAWIKARTKTCNDAASGDDYSADSQVGREEQSVCYIVETAKRNRVLSSKIGKPWSD